MTTIILVEPETPGNIGAVARAMANFGFNKLLLVNPQCNHLDEEAKNRAKAGLKVLEKAKITKNLKQTLKQFHTTIATTAMLGTDYNIPRSPLSPEQLASKIPTAKSQLPTAIIFGRESQGLSNEEVNLCDFVVTIPTPKQYPTLNLSMSVGIILYELSKKSNKTKTDTHFIPASKAEKDQIMKNMNQILNKIKFTTPTKKQTQKTIWKRIFSKAFLTKREAFAVIGLLKKLK